MWSQHETICHEATISISLPTKEVQYKIHFKLKDLHGRSYYNACGHTDTVAKNGREPMSVKFLQVNAACLP